MKHKKSKKCHPYRHTIPGIGTSGAVPVASKSEISQETTASRVPPLHPELSECSPQGPFGMDSSLQLPSSMQDQHPTNSPSYRTEHYLVTYPDGTKTLIQMPVSVENDKSFEFVLNVLPSPYREGTTLQLGVIPKNGNFSPHTPVQPLAGGMNIPVSTPGQGIPVTQVITPGSTMGNLAMGSLSQLRLGTSPLVSVPGPSASFSPGLAASSSRYDWSWSLPQSNPLRKTGMSALSPSNFVSHSRASPRGDDCFRSGFDRITSNFEEESSRPPIQILSSQSQPSQDRLFVSQNVIDAKEVASSSFNLTDSNSHEISIRMQNNPSKGIHQPERFVEILSSNGQLVVGDNQVTDNSNIETEVVYVSGLVDPLPAGSEISDPIIAQHVDVSSSVQHDDSQATESEAFVPV
ncbi:hypothetical protein BSL78_08592 [Apostichopus japonicus]|uniref:Uncharacterized protein n=1 Tax=Stichopus japonicus TaxID=307972 RepID=A0A2G8L2P0_STIJA|nr:hypothetical protein BSL78_08592 [Apostichopus japonicus]